MHTDLVINVFGATGNVQIRYIPTYCKGVHQCEKYKLFKHVSADTRGSHQGVYTMIKFS
jgi:hypothetical protein